MKRQIALLVAIAALSAACGGQVVFVEDDGSGASGAGGAGPGPGPGPGPGQTGTSTSSGVQTVCEAYCATWGVCSPGSDCQGDCESIFGGACDAELTAALICLANNFTGCEGNDLGCSAELDALTACQTPPSDCFTDFCDNGPDGSCYCSGTCYDEFKLEQQCYFPVGGNGGQPGGGPPPPPSTCDCFLDGSYLGSCDNFEFACSIEEGCCKALVLGE